MKTINLTKGKVALVDDADFDWLAKRKWYASQCRDRYYAYTPDRSSDVSMHRILLKAKPGQIVDHRNGDGLDNRRHNLRLCSKSENMQNSRKRPGTSQFKGVSWDSGRKKWAAFITANGKSMNLGRFKSEEDAAIAYDVAAQLFHGEFALLNGI